MILLTIIATIVLFLLLFSVCILSALGAAGIIILADIIVCILVLVWVAKKIITRRRNR